MKYPVFSYRDNKVGFGMPVIDQNEAAAIRGFSYAVNGRDGIMGFSPADFDLYKIGVFDSEKGTIEGFVPELVVSGASVFGAKV